MYLKLKIVVLRYTLLNMLRIYCDSNIYRYLNPTHPSYRHELFQAFDDLKGKMLFTFSDAHLDDLKNSDKEYALRDLELMTQYVNDNYFMHDFVRAKRTGPYLATPLEAFSNIDYEAYNRVMQNPFDFESLLSGVDEYPETKPLKQLMSSFYDLPIAAFTGDLHQYTNRDYSGDRRNFPAISETMTVREVLGGLWPYSKMLLEDKREFTRLRQFIASYINKDEYNFEKWGMAFNERFRLSPLGKSYMESIENMLTENQKENDYQRFNYAYTMLETYNITQERKRSGLKKFDLQSLNNDAHHAWYASFSDYLVTDDKGLQVKANIVYQLVKFPTKVLSSSDFINHRRLILGHEETIQSLLKSLNFDLKHSLQLHEWKDPYTNKVVLTYKPTHNYFNYFNRLQIVNSDDKKYLVLYCDRDCHANFMMYREVEILVGKLHNILGEDLHGRGKYKMEENNAYASNENIREWLFDGIGFFLTVASKSWGSTICLGVEFRN